MANSKFGKLGVGARILSIVWLSCFGFFVSGAMSARSLYANMFEDRREEIGYILETATHIVEYWHAQSTKGALPEADAKVQAREVLRQMRYNNGEYVFIVAMDGTAILQPAKPETEGSNVMEVKDSDGVPLFRRLVDAASAGKGEFVQYRWLRPGAVEPESKLSKSALFAPWGWVIGTGVYLGNMDAAVNAAVWSMVLSSLVILAAVVAAALWVSRGVTKPLFGLTGVMHRLAEHDLSVEVGGRDRGDELGDMARAVQVFKDNMLQVDRMREEQREARAQSEAERKRALREMADHFEATVKAKVNEVDVSTEGIRDTAQSMAGRSESSGSQSLTVGRAAQVTMERSAVVAEATRQLALAVDEVARQVAQSNQITQRAVDDVNATAQRMEALSGSVQSINNIVSLINDIASQTNLLALNATIEAARAGEAGKGFAVVAGEVKTLANQTAKATEQISQQVVAIQNSTEEMRTCIAGVVDTIRSVSNISTGIAGAIQEQEAATRDIASNIDEVANQAGEVSRSVVHLARASALACAGTVRVIWSAQSLTEMVDELRAEADGFLGNVRA